MLNEPLPGIAIFHPEALGYARVTNAIPKFSSWLDPSKSEL